MILILLSLIPYAMADIIMEDNSPPGNFTVGENIIMSSLWAMGLCTCIGKVCEYKKKIPVLVNPEDGKYYDGESKTYLSVTPKDKVAFEKFKKDINEVKRVITYLEKQEEYEKENEIFKEGVTEEIKYKFGTGEIRSKVDGKYYHGKRNDDKDMVESRLYTFKERIDKKPIKMNKLITKKHDEYCHNCSLDIENSKRRRVYDIYKCNGHTM